MLAQTVSGASRVSNGFRTLLCRCSSIPEDHPSHGLLRMNASQPFQSVAEHAPDRRSREMGHYAVTLSFEIKIVLTPGERTVGHRRINRFDHGKSVLILNRDSHTGIDMILCQMQAVRWHSLPFSYRRSLIIGGCVHVFPETSTNAGVRMSWKPDSVIE